MRRGHEPLGAPFFVRSASRARPSRPSPTPAGWLFEARPEERRRLYDRSFDILTRITSRLARRGLDFMLERRTPRRVAGSWPGRGHARVVAQGRLSSSSTRSTAGCGLTTPAADHPQLGDARLGNICTGTSSRWPSRLEMATIAPPRWTRVVARHRAQLHGGLRERQPAVSLRGRGDRAFEERLGRQVVGSTSTASGVLSDRLLIFRLNDMMVERGSSRPFPEGRICRHAALAPSRVTTGLGATAGAEQGGCSAVAVR